MISLSVPIRPRPTPRPRGKAGQHAYVPKDFQAYRDELGWAIKKAWIDEGRPTLEPPYTVIISLERDYIHLWLGESAKKRQGVRGDLDNIAKELLDTLQRVGIIGNDRNVHELTIGFA